MYCQIVFNLYPVTETLYLPSANVVQTDKSGQLTHLVQKATPSTIGAYGIEMTPVLKQLFDRVEALSPKNIELRFKPSKARAATPLAQLLAQAETKNTVENYIHRELDFFLADLVRHRLPLTLDAERRSLAKDVQLQAAKEELVPHLSFRKTEAGIEYRFQLGTETEKWNIREYDAIPLTNTSPAWVVAKYMLFRVPGINGNMLRPFRKKDTIHIPPDKVRVYFRQFIAKSAGRTQIEAEGFAVETADRLLTVRLEATENVLENSWLLKPVFVYDGAEFYYGERRDRVTGLDIPGDESREITVHLVCRNPEAEKERLDFLRNLALVAENRLLRLTDGVTLPHLLDWFTRHREMLENAGFSIAAPQLNGKTIALLPAGITVRSETAGDWFDLEGQVQIGPHTFPFRTFVPYLRRRDNLFPLPGDTCFLIPDEWFARYADLAQAAEENGRHGLRLKKSLFTILQQAGITSQDDNTGSFPVIDPEQIDYQPSESLKATLRPYQLYGVKWLVGHYRHGFGACLADDMGLGKTLQTIALLLYVKDRQETTAGLFNPTPDSPAFGTGQVSPKGDEVAGPQLSLFHTYEAEIRPLKALIILPASLVFNWQRELAQFSPSLFIYAHTGSKRLKDARALAGHDVVLTTYHTARQDLDLLGKIEWQVIVLDESQQIKNRESEVSKVVRALKGRYKISLSGTPIENSLADLWTQMEFINPDTLGSFQSFREQFLLPIEKANDESAKQRLFSRVRPFFLRRTKEEVAPDLPILSDQVFYSEMSAAQRKYYEKVKSAVRNEILSLFDDPKTRMMALQALTRLRQLANHPVLTEPEYSGDSGKFDDVMAQWVTVRRS
ncbi:MAG: SNF2-related protein, partial [Thermoanaerobaculia bacterium]|nr:SNF2-related protein [Thermoanaerobaculia bacterium]